MEGENRRARDLLEPTSQSSLTLLRSGSQVLYSFFTSIFAVVAQLVERIHGKDEVTGSNPVNGSTGRYRSGQPGQTVNLLAFAFASSNLARPTIKTTLFSEGVFYPSAKEYDADDVENRSSRSCWL